MVSQGAGQAPHEVTFASGARLLVQLGIDENVTPDYIRHIARSRDDWPFGEGRPHPYGQVANARTMNTEVFVDYFRANPPNPQRRGRSREPRAKKST